MIFEFSVPHKLLTKYLINYLKPTKDDKILDIGCGIGYLSKILSKCGSDMYGIDINLNALNEAKKNKGTFVYGSITKIPFNDNFFDKINATTILEHIPPPEVDKALSEIHRVGKKDATVIITVPCSRGLLTGTKYHRLGHTNKKGGEYHYVDGFNPTKLKEILENKNINVEKIKYVQFLVSEIITELAKIYLFKFKKKKYHSQVDVLNYDKTTLFKIYRLFFYPIYIISILENKILSPIFGGHIMIIKGRIKK